MLGAKCRIYRGKRANAQTHHTAIYAPIMLSRVEFIDRMILFLQHIVNRFSNTDHEIKHGCSAAQPCPHDDCRSRDCPWSDDLKPHPT